MKLHNDTIGEIIFWCATALAFFLYVLSAPAGLPWSGSTELALAYGGQIAELPTMPHPVWGYFIQVFGGHFVALSAVVAAMTAGLLGAIVNRYLGWRMGVAVALLWIFTPVVWNRAVIGAHGVFLVFGIVLAIWIANAAFLIYTRRARKLLAKTGVENSEATLKGWAGMTLRARVNRIVAWGVLGFSVVFVLFSVFLHDYTIGEAATAYARTMLDEAGDRTVILSGIADHQLIWEAERREKGSSARLILLRRDENYRRQLTDFVRREWPCETNLWMAAQIGATVFSEAVVRAHPEKVYVMTGLSTTPEKWAARWAAMKPYLGSSDGFLPVMRRAFAFEANALANRLQTDGKLDEAWALYWKIVEEVDAGNVSAYVNLSEMMRRGYAAEGLKVKRIEQAISNLRKELSKDRAARRAAAIVTACGPVMQDSKALAEYREEIRRRIEALAKEKNTKDWELPHELKSLVDWNNEMLRAQDRGDIVEAARIARMILSKREWRSFAPANAALGMAMSYEGDYVASEVFYRIAVAGQEKPPAVVCNDYADTLLHLGRYDEAEKYARLAIVQTDEREWICRLTLAEVLREAKKNPEEIQTLLKVVFRQAPEELRAKYKKEFAEQ